MALSAELLQLLDHLQATQLDLHPCGPAPLHLLQLIYAALHSRTAFKRAQSHASTLLHLADLKILSFHYAQVPLCWRRLYTDAILLGVIALLLREEEEEGQEGQEGQGEDAEWMEAIRQLDMVLIVAGAPGPAREDAVFTLLRLTQARLSDSPRPTKRPRPNPTPSPTPLSAPYITHPLQRFTPDTAPDLSTYLEGASSKPFVVTGGCLEWPAAQVGRWDSARYLSGVAGRGRVVPVEVGGDYTEEGWGQRVMSFDEFLDDIFGAEQWGQREALYLAQHALFRQLPALERDVLLPDYVYAEPGATVDVPGYKPPNAEEGWVMNAWLGPGGTLSPAHTDPYYNCYAQIVGSKWVWVAPPSCAPWMHAYASSPPSSTTSPPALPPDTPTTSDLAPNLEQPINSTATSHLLTNTSRVPVHLAPSSSSSSTSGQFADFEEHVAPKARQAVLGRGDLLVMPPGWWHSMYSLERSFGVSIWY